MTHKTMIERYISCFVLFIFLTGILMSCNLRKDCCFNSAGNNSDSTINILSEWKRDSLGCLGLRHKHILFIIKYIQNEIKKPEKLVSFLGNPNTYFYDKNKDYVNITYYYEVKCTDGELAEENVYAWLLIAFSKKHFKGFTVFCEG